MFSSRSSFEKPRPLVRWVRTTSPSSTSTLWPSSRRRFSRAWAMVVLPADGRPVNQTVRPSSRLGTRDPLGRCSGAGAFAGTDLARERSRLVEVDVEVGRLVGRGEFVEVLQLRRDRGRTADA